MALSKDRNTLLKAGDLHSDPVAANTRIFAGALMCLDASGNAVPGATATDLVARGRADEHIDNTDGAAGDQRIRSSRGVFCFDNSAGADEITRAHIGSDAYIVDDHTVAATDGTGTRSIAGRVDDVDAAGVWVAI